MFYVFFPLTAFKIFFFITCFEQSDFDVLWCSFIFYLFLFLFFVCLIFLAFLVSVC